MIVTAAPPKFSLIMLQMGGFVNSECGDGAANEYDDNCIHMIKSALTKFALIW